MWGTLKQAANWVSKGASISGAIAEIRDNPVGTLAKVAVGLAVGAAVVAAAPYVAAGAAALGVSAAVVTAVAPIAAVAATAALGYVGDEVLKTDTVQGVIKIGNEALKETAQGIVSVIKSIVPKGVGQAIDRAGKFLDNAVKAANEFTKTIGHAGGFIDKAGKAVSGVLSAVNHARKGEWGAAVNDVKSAVTAGHGAVHSATNVAISATKATTHTAAAAEIAATGNTGKVTEAARQQQGVVASLISGKHEVGAAISDGGAAAKTDTAQPGEVTAAAVTPVAPEAVIAQAAVVAPNGQAAATDLAPYSALVAAREAAAAARATGVDARHANTDGRVEAVAHVHNARPKSADVQMA